MNAPRLGAGLTLAQRVQAAATLLAGSYADASSTGRNLPTDDWLDPEAGREEQSAAAMSMVDSLEAEARKRERPEESDQSNDTGFKLPEPYPFRMVMG